MKYQLDKPWEPLRKLAKRRSVNKTKKKNLTGCNPKVIIFLMGCNCEWCVNARRQAQQEYAEYDLPPLTDEQWQMACLEVDLESYREHIALHAGKRR